MSLPPPAALAGTCERWAVELDEAEPHQRLPDREAKPASHCSDDDDAQAHAQNHRDDRSCQHTKGVRRGPRGSFARAVFFADA